MIDATAAARLLLAHCVDLTLEISDDARQHLLRELAMFQGRRPVVCVSWMGASAELSRTESGGTRLTRSPASGFVVVGVAPRNLDPLLVEDVRGIPVFVNMPQVGIQPIALRLELEEGSVVVRAIVG